MSEGLGEGGSDRLLALGARVAAVLVLTAAMAWGTVSQAPFAAATEGASVAAAGESAGAAETVLTTGTAETTGSVVPSSTPASASAVATTAPFARILGTGVRIHLPAGPRLFVAVGFHQASYRKAKRLVPGMKCLGIKKASTMRAMLRRHPVIKLFQQPRRGRGTSNLSAADCAVKPKTVVVAPVSGVVTGIRKYKLYGRITDLRLEIKPDGAPRARVVMLHITGVKVKKGWRVTGGVSQVAVVRHLKINSTVNRFVPVKPVDHVHIQVNDDRFKGSF